jgi:hypothetical protein
MALAALMQLAANVKSGVATLRTIPTSLSSSLSQIGVVANSVIQHALGCIKGEKLFDASQNQGRLKRSIMYISSQITKGLSIIIPSDPQTYQNNMGKERNGGALVANVTYVAAAVLWATSKITQPTPDQTPNPGGPAAFGSR